jgi:DNA-directed RNA polymerase subunit RPC12/RpoP
LSKKEMSQVALCPTCGSKSKVKEKDSVVIYQAVQDEEAFKKIGQLKKAMMKYKEMAEQLEKELAALKSA